MSEYIVMTDGEGNEFPTGEVFVRCRDCKHFKPFEAFKIDGYKCTRVATPFEVYHDGFCAWGERP